MKRTAHGFVTPLIVFILFVLFAITACQWRAVYYLNQLAVEKHAYMQKKYAILLLAQWSSELIKCRFDDIMQHLKKTERPLKSSLDTKKLIDKSSLNLTIEKLSDELLSVKAVIESPLLAQKRFEYHLAKQIVQDGLHTKIQFTASNWHLQM